MTSFLSIYRQYAEKPSSSLTFQMNLWCRVSPLISRHVLRCPIFFHDIPIVPFNSLCLASGICLWKGLVHTEQFVQLLFDNNSIALYDNEIFFLSNRCIICMF